MQTDWEGFYLDGQTATRQRATIRLMRNGLQVSTESGAPLWWPYREIRQTQGFYAGEQVRLERGGNLPEAVLVQDVAFLSRLHRVAPELAHRFHDPARRRMRAGLTILAGLAVIGMGSAVYLWGIPTAASLAADRVPASWEERLGASVIAQLAPPKSRCVGARPAQAIQEIVATLTSTLPKSPYTFHVLVVNAPTVNALAAPGGYIVLFRGLLERTRSAEELAGVLAHELQHILHRHATRALLQQASTGILLAALTGDVSGVPAFAVASAQTLGMLRYSRQSEDEADTEGMRMLLAARIDPAGMIAFFETLEKKGRGSPGLSQYLSTHPRTADRVARLESLAAQSHGPPITLLPGVDWRGVRAMCQSPGTPGSVPQSQP